MRVVPTFRKTLALSCATVLVLGAGITAAAATTLTRPIAVLSLSSTAPAVGTAVLADAHTSRFPAGDRFKRASVTYGDGSKAVPIATAATRVKHTYTRVGTFTVTVTVVDVHLVAVKASRHVVVHALPVQPFPVKVPAGLLSSTKISQLPLTAVQVTGLATRLSTSAALLKTLPVGYLALLPSTVVARPAGGLPRLPGLVGLPLSGDIVSLLPNVVGLPIALPWTVNPVQSLGSLPTSLLSAAQLGVVSALFGIPVTTLSQLPVRSVLLLPGNLLKMGPIATQTLPVTPPAGLSPAALVSSLGLSTDTITAFATQLGVPAGVLPGLPVGFLSLLPTSLLTQPAGGLPSLPGLAGLPLTGDLVSLLPALTGLPITLPTGLNPAQALGSLPTSVLSAAQLGSLSTLFGVSPQVLGQLPLSSLGLLPGNLLQSGTVLPVLPPLPVISALPIAIPTGLVPASLISSLALSPEALTSVSGLLNIPTATLPTLPVGILKLLPASALTLPAGGLPGLPGLGSLPLIGNVLGLLLSGLPIALPSGVSPLQSIGSLSSPLSLLQLTTLSTFFGIPQAVLTTLPVNVLTLLPTGLLSGL